MDSEWKRIPGKDNAWSRPIDSEIIAKMPGATENFIQKYNRKNRNLLLASVGLLAVTGIVYLLSLPRR